MNTNEDFTIAEEHGLDLVQFWRLLVTYKYLIALVVVAAGCLAVYIAFTATMIYRAETTVTSVSDDGASGPKSIASQFGGLANLAGLNLFGNDKSQTALAILKSRNLVEEFISRNDLIPILYPTSRPTLWRAVQQFRKNILQIREDKRAGTVIVTIDWSNAAEAADWANRIVGLANEILRSRAIGDSKRNIEYLNAQLARTDIVEVRGAIYNLIESETKTAMLANARAEYAFSTVDRAVVPEIRISPNRTAIVGLGLLAGFFVGVLIAFIHRRIVASTAMQAKGALA